MQNKIKNKEILTDTLINSFTAKLKNGRLGLLSYSISYLIFERKEYNKSTILINVCVLAKWNRK